MANTDASSKGSQGLHNREIDDRLEDLGRRAYNDEFYLRYYVGHKGNYGMFLPVAICETILWFHYIREQNHQKNLNLRILSIPGHEFMEFELTPSGKLRYANNSNYKQDAMIRKEVCVSPGVVEELKRIILISEITTVDDREWEETKDMKSRQELEIKIGNEHIAFTCGEILSLVDVQKGADPKGMSIFYFLTQDLKCLVMSLMNLHFKVKPIPT